ncbi:MAG: hypothetical protein HWD58_04225 [Bacteroidota bacterium]|nr:MAG: hypothetical protein HWD58_04225 [Bacteroidota bacterium]
MHFIQNTWFASNVMFVLFFCLACLSAVAYMNNRIRIYKKAMYATLASFLLAMAMFVSSEHATTGFPVASVPSASAATSQVESNPSVLSRVADFVLDIVKQKVSE